MICWFANSHISNFVFDRNLLPINIFTFDPFHESIWEPRPVCQMETFRMFHLKYSWFLFFSLVIEMTQHCWANFHSPSRYIQTLPPNKVLSLIAQLYVDHSIICHLWKFSLLSAKNTALKEVSLNYWTVKQNCLLFAFSLHSNFQIGQS